MNRWSRGVLWGLLALWGFVLPGCKSDEKGSGESLVAWSSCGDEDKILRALTSVNAQCTTVQVPENPDKPEGRILTLRVAKIPAVSPNPEPDPLFVLAGGPGQSATQVGPQLLPFLSGINEKRDIILVDQRGTGGSNLLQCDPPDDDSLKNLFVVKDTTQDAQDCLKTLKEKADLRYYTTPFAVDDLDAVRAALGYSSINLWGGSYGTRAALEYLRRHEDRVRTVVLDGVAPVGMRLPLNVAQDGTKAMESVFDTCESLPSCQEAFPDLRSRTSQWLTSLETPVDIALNNPRTGKKETVTLTAMGIAQTIQSVLYVSELVALLPLALHKAVYGDLSTMATLALTMGEGQEGLAVGMHLSVVCAEDVQFIKDVDAQAASKESRVARGMLEEYRSKCAFWPTGILPDDFLTPVASDKPVLLLSGEFDPVTAPRWAEKASETLSNSLQVVVPGTGHGTTPRGCVPKVIAAFVESGTLDGIDTKCVELLGRSPFFVSNAGPGVSND